MHQPLFTMNKVHTVFSALIILSCTLFSPAQAYQVPQTPTQFKAYYNSGTYEKELTQAIVDARRFIIARADSNKKNDQDSKLAIILDIDETSLSNYPKMVAHNFVNTKEQIHQAILQGDAPAIAPTLSLYNEALQHGVTVFFVTGRHESEREATIDNLKKAGYKNWAGLYVRPNDYDQPSIVPFKSQTRAAIARKGYLIIASIGDQQSDLTGGYAEKTFKLPNPYYYLP